MASLNKRTNMDSKWASEPMSEEVDLIMTLGSHEENHDFQDEIRSCKYSTNV